MDNFYVPIEATITKIIDETPTIKTFCMKPVKDIAFATGQFVEIAVPGMGEAPFTPSSSPLVQDKMDVTIMGVGRVTEHLHSMKEGSLVGIRGPFGKGYPLHEMYGKSVLILGGGVGMAPLRSFLLSLLAERDKFKRIILSYGARTPDDIVYKDQYREWMRDESLEVHRSVDKADESWSETEGVVTVLLDKFDLDVTDSVAVVCGPPIMMKFGTFKCLEKGFAPEQIYLSMEKNMSCGVGKCGHCQLGRFFVCKDGPVFTYDKIKDIPEIWD